MHRPFPQKIETFFNMVQYYKCGLKQYKTIINHPQITINMWYKPFPNGWFMIVLPTLQMIFRSYSSSQLSNFCQNCGYLPSNWSTLSGPLGWNHHRSSADQPTPKKSTGNSTIKSFTPRSLQIGAPHNPQTCFKGTSITIWYRSKCWVLCQPNLSGLLWKPKIWCFITRFLSENCV